MNEETLYTFYINNVKNITIDIFEMNYESVEEWHTNHQPLAKQDQDVDSTWDWRFIYIHTFCTGVILHQNVKGYVARIEGTIVGMMILALDYACNIDKKINQERNIEEERNIPSFLWYITKSKIVEDLEIMLSDECKKIIKIDFFNSMLSVIYNETKKDLFIENNAFWLHADKKGGEDLISFYEYKGMLHCPLNSFPSVRRDDGRFMFMRRNKLFEIVTSK